MGKTVKVKAKTKTTVKRAPRKISGGDSGAFTAKMVLSVKKSKK